MWRPLLVRRFLTAARTETANASAAKFVDDYIKQRVQQAEAKDDKDKHKVDERLERIVGNMFDRCFKENDFKPALGIAIESRRLDKIRESIKLSPDRPAMLAYGYRICMNQVTSREFRQEVRMLSYYALLKSWRSSPHRFCISSCRCIRSSLRSTTSAS